MDGSLLRAPASAGGARREWELEETAPPFEGPSSDAPSEFTTERTSSHLDVLRPWMHQDEAASAADDKLVLAGTCLGSYFRCIALAGAPRARIDGVDRSSTFWFRVWPWVVAAWCTLGCVCIGLGFVHYDPVGDSDSFAPNGKQTHSTFGVLMGAMFLCYSPAMNCAQIHACRTDIVNEDGTGALEKLATMPITRGAVKLLKSTQPLVDYNANLFFVPYWLAFYAVFSAGLSTVHPMVFVGAAIGCIAWGNVVQSGIGVAGAAAIIISDQVKQFTTVIKKINASGDRASSSLTPRARSVLDDERLELRVRLVWLVREVIPLYERGWSVVCLTRMLEMLFGSAVIWYGLVHDQLGGSYFYKAVAFALTIVFTTMAAYTMYIPMQVTIDTQILLTELNGLIARVSFEDAQKIDLQLFQFLKRSNGHDGGPGVMFFGARVTPRLLVQFAATLFSGLVSVGGYTVNGAVEQLKGA